jgi:hypothetical protein
VFCNVIVFDPTAAQALAALDEKDAVTLSGELTVSAYAPKSGGDPRASVELLAHALVSAYHASRKRSAMQGQGSQAAQEGSGAARGGNGTHGSTQARGSAQGTQDAFNDDVPW